MCIRYLYIYISLSYPYNLINCHCVKKTPNWQPKLALHPTSPALPSRLQNNDSLVALPAVPRLVGWWFACQSWRPARVAGRQAPAPSRPLLLLASHVIWGANTNALAINYDCTICPCSSPPSSLSQTNQYGKILRLIKNVCVCKPDSWHGGSWDFTAWYRKPLLLSFGAAHVRWLCKVWVGTS